MPRKQKADCLGTSHRLLKAFLKQFGAQLIDPAGIDARTAALGCIDAIVTSGWVNDSSTLTFEMPLEGLTGPGGLAFAQEVWMTQPSLFEYVEVGSRAIVRLWWNTDLGAAPYTARPADLGTRPSRTA